MMAVKTPNMTTSLTPAFAVNSLCVHYGAHRVVDEVSFHLNQGTITALMGPNGAGKTTALRASLGLIPAERGEALVHGKALKSHRRAIAYVPQRSQVDWNFPITVKETALLGTYPRLGRFAGPGKTEKARAAQALETVELTGLEDRPIARLSGGQQQRMFLARALAQDADIIILDEPLAGVDARSEELIMQVLGERRDQGATVLAVHHDLSTAQQYFDRAILLNRTIQAAGDVAEVCTADNLAGTYGLTL